MSYHHAFQQKSETLIITSWPSFTKEARKHLDAIMEIRHIDRRRELDKRRSQANCGSGKRRLWCKADRRKPEILTDRNLFQCSDATDGGLGERQHGLLDSFHEGRGLMPVLMAAREFSVRYAR